MSHDYTGVTAEDNGEIYEVYAIRYATNPNRTRGRNFMMTDAHDTPMPIDFYVWAIVGATRAYLVDTGFDRALGAARGHQFLCDPAEAIRELGLDPGDLRDVIVSHMHFDHVGNYDRFPKACFHVQEQEMAFATGRYMQHAELRRPYVVDHVCGMVRCLYAGRVAFHAGGATLAPGITLHHVGGHTAGLQAVRVRTSRGWIVLASDAAHFYANMDEGISHPTMFHVGQNMESWVTIRQLADSRSHIIPGHDPLVAQSFPRANTALGELCVRLDREPIGWT